MALDAIGAHSPLDSYTINNAWNAHHIGKSIFKEDYSLFPGVREMLELLSRTSTKLILNTKGADDVQHRKVVINAVEQYFDDVVITLAKNKEHLQNILDKHDLRPEEVLCVGDSAVDDIIAPQDLGCWTVWISDIHPDNFKPKWIYEEGIKEIHPEHYGKIKKGNCKRCNKEINRKRKFCKEKCYNNFRYENYIKKY
ncbi:MAG: HAD hydrolase-like protein [Bacteroidetes bacterium]|nr:HAD hydrolase-like protein [Bacteroidota bacterium]